MKNTNSILTILLAINLMFNQVALAEGKTAEATTNHASNIISGASYFIFEGENQEKQVDYFSKYAIFYSASCEELGRVLHYFNRQDMTRLLDPQAGKPLVARYKIQSLPSFLCLPFLNEEYLYLFDKHGNTLAYFLCNTKEDSFLRAGVSLSLNDLRANTLTDSPFDLSQAMEDVLDDSGSSMLEV